MEQISLENKVNNTLKWLANEIARIQVYHWNEEYKKESLNNAWQRVQEQFKKDIDWNILTESQCKALHFGKWQSEEDIEEQISFLKSELEKGHLTKEEFDKKVANEKNTIGLRLIPLYLYPSLPIGTILTSIDGKEIVFDGSNIDTLEGKMKADIGDYIIKGINGEFYPCKPDIFSKTYEEVTE